MEQFVAFFLFGIALAGPAAFIRSELGAGRPVSAAVSQPVLTALETTTGAEITLSASGRSTFVLAIDGEPAMELAPVAVKAHQ